jgi:hypothetical protein
MSNIDYIVTMWKNPSRSTIHHPPPLKPHTLRVSQPWVLVNALSVREERRAQSLRSPCAVTQRGWPISQVVNEIGCNFRTELD